MPRLFAAIDLPVTLVDSIVANHSGLPGAKWEKQPHITLVYFGEVAADRVDQVVESLNRVSFDSFELRPTEVGYFGESESPFVVWIGLARSGSLEALHAELLKVRSEFSLPPKHTGFVPHITLAHTAEVNASDLERYVSGLDLSTLVSFNVDKFHLYQSDNGSYARLATVETAR